MLVSLIPLFDENLAVKAYSIFTQKHNFLLNPILLGTSKHDGSPRIEGLELIQEMGIDTVSDSKEIFVSVTNISIFSDVRQICTAPRNRIVLLIDNTIPPVEMYINRLKELKEQGYKLAVRKIPITEFANYGEIFKLMDYVFLNCKKIVIDKAQIYFGKLFPNVRICIGNIETLEQFQKYKKQDGNYLYEGSFYRIPATKGETNVAPLKVNYIELLNIVNNDNYDLSKAADIIARDTALTILLLKMVNNMARNSEITSIRHAAAMLGQRELKKWINTAVVNALYADKPNEITRVSLLRAKFAENLAEGFGLAMKTEELFIMGLFSVLDVILDKTMKEALQVVKVSKDIEDALVEQKGKLAPILDFVKQYEDANWSEISRQMVLYGISMELVEKSYIDSLVWYRRLFS